MKTNITSEEDFFNELIPQFSERGIDLGIDRMRMALNALGRPCDDIPAIQIIGTNGKGSIASLIESTLKFAGIKAGTTVSPHLVSWCERIHVNGDLISYQEFQECLISIKPISDKYNLTPFELIIAAAFKHFNNHNVQALILEAGLGGRLDATTAHPYRPVIAMASIGLDHCDYLGSNLKDITTEKAAAITPGCRVISAIQHPHVSEVLEQTVKSKNAHIEWVSPLPEDWTLGLNGDVQRNNAAVAKGAIKVLEDFGWKIEEQQIRKGFALANWTGRLQKANWNNFPLLIDCAHNPHAAKQLSNERKHWEHENKGIQWILGIQTNKDAPRMICNLVRPNDRVWIVPVPNHSSWSKLQLSQSSPKLESKLLQANNVEEVLIEFSSKNMWPNPCPVIAGSIYLIGDLLRKKIIETSTKEKV